jgi:ATP-dependent RNA helicase DDX3X
MAKWDTSADGGAAAASFKDTNDRQADNTTDTTPTVGGLSEAETVALAERAREAGWVDTVPVNYDVQRSSREDELTHYLQHSAVYEWADEYGDVGPEIPELEEQLFGGDFRVRKGNHMGNLQFEVTVEGPDKLQPTRSVSIYHSLNFSHAAIY